MKYPKRLCNVFQVPHVFYPGLNTIFEHLKAVKHYNTSVQINTLLQLDDLLEYVDNTDYYTYSGSLTTPPCSEAVTWIIFRDTLAISRTQVDDNCRL